MQFEHIITILVRTTEDNPDMPSININTLADHLRDEAVAVLTGGSFLMVQAQVTLARRTQ